MRVKYLDSSYMQPRIDPLQLLKCLGVLLTPNGGIRSKEEVQRLASLMMKFSKKLVSKCVYILILKNTDIELLGMFMSAGGWTLVFTWLSDGICGKNWALVSELLELLLICPVDVERLKSNSIPRLVKGLSKDESLGGVNVLATKLVEQWLKIVKDETVPEREVVQQPVIVKQEAAETSEIISTSILEQPITIKQEEVVIKKEDLEEIENESKTLEIPPQTFYKVTVRDGKQVIHKVENEETTMGTVIKEEVVETDEVSVPQSSFPATTIVPENKDTKEKVTELKEKKEGDEKKVNKERSSKHHDKKHKSSSSSSSNSSSSSKSSSHKDSNKDKSSSSSSRDKHKSRDKKHRDKEHRSNGQHKSSSNSSKENKEKQAEKDRATLAKVQPHSIDKLGKIPKKSSSSNDSKDKSKNEKKDDGTSQKHKSSISIEVRKKVDGERPKTVKVFNSKLRSTGLEEAPKPPPSRQAVKKPSATLPAVIPLKRPSPSREAPPPPEKKIKLPEPEEKQEKPGGIKLIPPKPKPAFLQESDMFMDALAASAHNKKEPKKRKRRTSVTKDNTTPTTPTSPPTSPSNPLSSPLSSPTSLKAIAPKFYKDTLETDENKTSENEEVKTNNIEEPTSGETGESEEKKVKINDDVKNESTVIKGVDGLKGVLVHHKKRGPKKSVKWRNDSELEEIQYFELDETERVNVTKTFTDMKQMEHVGEREALQLSRKLPHEDTMDERTTWKALIIIDLPPPLAEPGSKSTEKAVQYAREKNILQAIYFNKSMLPDSPAEPRHEIHNIVDPVVIPLIDVTGNPDSVNDYQNTPWPEPKGSPPHNIQNNIPNVQPNIFQGGMPQFNNALGPPNFPGPLPTVPFAAPAFGPNVMGGDWRIGDGSVMPQDVITHGPINPNMFNNRPDGFNNMMEDGGYGPNPQNFGPGPGPGGPGPGMGPGPGPMYQNFVGNRGGNRGGGFRNMNRGGWFRPSGPPPGWHGGPRGGQGWGGRGGGSAGICKQYKMQGFCRNRDSCPYMHPQGNGPY